LIVSSFVILFCAINCCAAQAESLVSGSQNSVVLHARDASIPEIFSALRSALGLKITLTGSVSRRVTGDYSGPIRRVLSSVLGNTNYIVKTEADTIVVSIIGGAPGSAGAQPIVVAAVEEPNSTVQGWMPAEDPLIKFKNSHPDPSASSTPLSSALVEAEDSNPVQGYMPKGDPFAAYRNAQQKSSSALEPNSALVVAEEAEDSNPVQGYMPKGDPFAAYRNTQQKSTSAPEPNAAPAAAEEAEESSPIQGYMPKGDPFAAYRNAQQKSAAAPQLNSTSTAVNNFDDAAGQVGKPTDIQSARRPLAGLSPKNPASGSSSDTKPATVNPSSPPNVGMFAPISGDLLQDSDDDMQIGKAKILPGRQTGAAKIPGSIAPQLEAPGWAK
jgi:hypothetical protein